MAKRVLVLGGGGMLGHKAFRVLSDQFDTMVAFRQFDDRLRNTGLFSPECVIAGVDATDLISVRRALEQAQPDCVVNCFGIIKQREAARRAAALIHVNALFPHLLAELCAERGTRLVHVSTDCVFSGRRGNYTEDDAADAEDLYGRTKYLGEVGCEGALTLRTSIVGRELFTDLSLVDWFLSQRGGTVRGYTHAVFSGLTTQALSREIGRVIGAFPKLSGIYHVSAERISKYQLLLLVRRAYGIDVTIEPYDGFRCDRSLDSSRYRMATGFQPPSWDVMVDEMARDATPYDAFRQLAAGAEEVAATEGAPRPGGE
jgi:dTDP-4-dehydrorhamnose reductase